MAGDYGGMMPGRYPGAFGGMPRVSGPDAEPRGPPRGSFPQGGMDGWDGRDPGWSGPPADEMAKWGTRDAPMNPHGMPGRGPPMMMDGRGRGGYGRGPDGRGGYGRFGRGGRWGPEDDYDAPRNWNYGEPQGMGDGMGMPGRGGFRGRMPDPGRGRGGPYGRWGPRPPGWQGGRGRRESWSEGEPRQPGMDPAVLERRRASAAALLKSQVSQLQVSRELLGEDEVAEEYARVMEGEGELPPRPDVRRLYTYPMFAVEEGAAVAASPAAPDAEPHAFEQCLVLYQEAQAGSTVVQSENGNFLMPVQ